MSKISETTTAENTHTLGTQNAMWVITHASELAKLLPEPEEGPWLMCEVTEGEDGLGGIVTGWHKHDVVERVGTLKITADREDKYPGVVESGDRRTQWQTNPAAWALLEQVGAVGDGEYMPRYGYHDDPKCPEPDCDSRRFVTKSEGIFCKTCEAINPKEAWKYER